MSSRSSVRRSSTGRTWRAGGRVDLGPVGARSRRRAAGRPRRPAGPADGDADAGRDEDLPPAEAGTGRESAAARSATRAASRGPYRSRRMPNSSLPNRATDRPGAGGRWSRRRRPARSRSPAAWPRLSLTTLNRSRSRMSIAIGPVSPTRPDARAGGRGPSAGPVRQAREHVVEGRVRALAALGRARSNRRALSRAIEASWANRASAATSRSLNVAPGSPEARPMRPRTRPRRGQRHGDTAPNDAASQVRPPARVGAVVVDVHRPAGPRQTVPPTPVARRDGVAEEVVEQADADAARRASEPSGSSR